MDEKVEPTRALIAFMASEGMERLETTKMMDRYRVTVTIEEMVDINEEE